jgi:ABC-type molybdenum transport system ATPase subunit/photorepair protein PhrA
VNERLREMLTAQKSISERGTLLEGSRKSALSKVQKLSSTVRDLEIFAIKIEKTLKVLAALVNKKVENDLKVINTLVTNGLRTVFPDRDVTFKSYPVEVGGKIQIDFLTEENGKEVSDDAYGSVSVVESLILRMICMNRMKTGKMLLLDETFSALDNDYVTRVGTLLKELAEQMKIDILLVSFNPGASEAVILRATLNNKTRTLSVVKEGK